MPTWDKDDGSAPRDAGAGPYDRSRRDDPSGRPDRDWREPRDWRRAESDGGWRPQPPPRREEPRRDRPDARFGSQAGSEGRFNDTGRRDGDGGDSAFGQMSRGSSTSSSGGYEGANVGGWGQSGMNSQWGQGGFGPLYQGLDYGQGGGRFGPAGYDTGNFGPTPTRHRDEHHAHYSRWRDDRLADHDRDYARWRDEQGRRYDSDYHSWRNERHDAFRQEFEGWRTGRDERGTAPADMTAPSPVDEGALPLVHGGNPTLARIADGDTGHHRHHRHDEHPVRSDEEPDPSRS